MPYKEILKYLIRYKKDIYKIIAVSFVIALFNATIPAIYGLLTDMVLKDNFGFWLFVLLGFWLYLTFITSLLNRYFERQKNYIAAFAERDLVVEANSHLIQLPLSYHKEKKIGEVFEKISRAGNMIANILTNIIFFILPQTLTVMIILLILAITSLKLALLILLIIIIYSFVTLSRVQKLVNSEERISELYETAYGDMYDSVINVKAIKSFSMEAEEKNKYQRQYEKIVIGFKKIIDLWININFAQANILGVGLVAIFVFALYLLKQGEISAGQLVMLIGYTGMITKPFVNLEEKYISMKKGMVSLKRVEAIIREKTEPYKKNKIINGAKGKIEFKNVSVIYENDKRETLKNISFIANAGEIIALVGESGAGKTTLADLIPRFIPLNKGKILLDGSDIAKINLKSLREKIAIVPQEPILFNDTVRANIGYGNIDANEKEIVNAAKNAYAHDFIMKFPKGYNQLVGERGIKLSAGQKQRLAIARAVLRNPKILILDEATSALDSISEKLIQKALAELIKGKTVFVIAHRLSTIRHADKILVLKDGTIIEKGTHKELLKQNGIYKELHDLQSF